MELNKIYLGDAYELIKQVPDKSVDGIYTDPPYLYDNSFGNRLRQQNKITESTKNHIEKMSCGVKRELLDQMVRVMKYIYIYMVQRQANHRLYELFCKRKRLRLQDSRLA